MRDWSKELREHADAIDRAAVAFAEFMGTDSQDNVEKLQEVSEQFREDADEYEQINHDKGRMT